MHSEAKENKMGVMPVNRLLLTMSLPMMLSMLIQALYNVVDSLFVAAIGGAGAAQYELTAVTLAFPAQNLMIAIGVGTGVGINALISRTLGMGDKERAKKIAGNGLFLLALSYVLFALLGIFASRAFFEMQTDIPEVIDLGVTYLTICTVASFGFFGQVAFEKFMQSTGKTVLSMTTQLVGAIFNIIFDPIFIFVLDMGIAGAAAATVGGQILSMIVGYILNQRLNDEVKISLRHVRPDARIIGDIYKIGLPSILMNSVGSVMTTNMNIILGRFEKAAVDVFGIYFKLQSFVFMPVFGFNNGLISIVAYNFGAQKRARMTRAIKLGLIYACSVMLLGLLVFQTCPDILLSMFNADENMIRLGTGALRTISLCFVFAGVSVIMISVFQALGYSFLSMIVSIARQLIVLLPAAYLLSLTGEVNNVWYAFPIAELVCLLCCILFFAIVYKKVIKKVPNN